VIRNLSEFVVPLNVRPKPLKKSAAVRLRKWQEEAFKQLYNERYCQINAPTGSGKTTAERWITFNKLTENWKLRSIIAVPQEIISHGFKETFISDGNKIIKSEILNAHNLCEKGFSDLKLDAIKQFFKIKFGKLEMLSERVLLISHDRLVAFYKWCVKTDNLSLFNDTIVTIDEGHHIRASEDLNGLGSVVRGLMSKTNAQLFLTSASWFRGDKMSCLGDLKNKFSRFDLPIDRFLKDYFAPGSTVTMSVLLSDPNHPEEILDAIEKSKGIKKTIAWLSPVASYQTKIVGGKYDLAKKILNGRTDYLDLVEDNVTHRKKVKKTIAERKNTHIYTLAQCMGIEGYNDVALERGIIIGSRNSYTQVVQMLGRLLRPWGTEKHIELYIVIPKTNRTTAEDFNEQTNEYFKTIMLLLLINDEIIMPTLHVYDRKTLTNIGLDLNETADIVSKICDRYIKAIDDKDNTSLDAISAVLNEEFGDRFNESEIDELIDSTQRIFSAWNQQITGGTVDVTNDPLGFLKCLSADFGYDSLQKMRAAIYKIYKFKTENEHIEKCKEFKNKIEWIRFYKSYIEEGWYCFPWISFNYTQAKWSELVGWSKSYHTRKEHIEKCKEFKGYT
jgi:hypothetical protein